MKTIRGRSGKPSSQRSDTFTGEVWADTVMEETDSVRANNIFFAPAARTYWHRHEHGQLLQVTSGQGKVCSKGGESLTLRAGDCIWFEPGEEHWHGADEDSYLVHFAVSLGTTEWLQEVSDEEYRGNG